MHSAVASLTDAQAVIHPLLVSSPRFTFYVIPKGISLGLARGSFPAMLFPSFLHTSLLAEHGELRSPGFRRSAT